MPWAVTAVKTHYFIFASIYTVNRSENTRNSRIFSVKGLWKRLAKHETIAFHKTFDEIEAVF